MDFASMTEDELKRVIINKQFYTQQARLQAIQEMRKRGIPIQDEYVNSTDENTQDISRITGDDAWITGLRAISWLIFIVIFGLGLYYGMTFIHNDNMIMGIGIIAVGFITAFLAVASTMVLLNAAQNLAIIREIKQREYYER